MILYDFIITVAIEAFHGLFSMDNVRVSVWHFLYSTSLAVNKDAEKFASAAYPAVVNTIDIKIKRMIIFLIFIPNPQTGPVFIQFVFCKVYYSSDIVLCKYR